MHNLHLIVIHSTSAEDACNEVETMIEDFGNENNWRTICGCVSDKNEVYIHDAEGRYVPSEDYLNTIEKINENVKGWMRSTLYGENAKKRIEEGNVDFTNWSAHELWELKEYVEYLRQIQSFKEHHNVSDIEEFDVLNHTFYPYEYAECGVTFSESEDGENTYIVFIDMHS